MMRLKSMNISVLAKLFSHAGIFKGEKHGIWLKSVL